MTAITQCTTRGICAQKANAQDLAFVLWRDLPPYVTRCEFCRIKADFVLVSANGVDLERQNAAAAKKIIKTTPRPLTLVLRDTSIVSGVLHPNQQAHVVRHMLQTFLQDVTCREVCGKRQPRSKLLYLHQQPMMYCANSAAPISHPAVCRKGHREEVPQA